MRTAKEVFVSANRLATPKFLGDTGIHRTRTICKKDFDDDGHVEVIQVVEGNLLMNAGIDELWSLVAADVGATAFNNANSYVGVGDSTTTEAATQTDLLGTNKLRKGMDSGYPVYGSNQKITFKSTFGTTEANFTWNELGVFNAATAGTMLNRKVSNLGTKTTGTFSLTVDISLS